MSLQDQYHDRYFDKQRGQVVGVRYDGPVGNQRMTKTDLGLGMGGPLELPKSNYDFGDIREETYEECVMRTAGSGGTGLDDPCKTKPRQIIPLPEERVQYFLDNPEEAMPKGNGLSESFLFDYVQKKLK
tara:strand:+ start:1175 stop:1561 length:387 start_codon:yes stop_codon:yes gene_type:complete